MDSRVDVNLHECRPYEVPIGYLPPVQVEVRVTVRLKVGNVVLSVLLFLEGRPLPEWLCEGERVRFLLVEE